MPSQHKTYILLKTFTSLKVVKILSNYVKETKSAR